MSIYFESGNPIPNQVTPERLGQARLLITRLVETDPISVQEGVELAERLEGVSEAVSDIVIARLALETSVSTQVAGNGPHIIPSILTKNILKKFANPDTQLGRMFAARPSSGHGASLSVEVISERERLTVLGVKIPPDYMIDRFLTYEPCLWDDAGITSRDSRRGRIHTAFPFSAGLNNPGDSAKYFRTLQELSSELLAVT